MPISSAFYTREIDLETAHTDLEITVGTFSWVQFFCDGGVNGIKVSVGTQNTNVINLNEFRTIPVVEGQKAYITNDVRSGRSRLLMVFSRTAPLESYQGGDPVNNAELAARLGSIQTFDRRGEVIFADDFESGLAKWTTVTDTAAGSTSLSTVYARSGVVSCKLVTAATTDAKQGIKLARTYISSGKIGIEAHIVLASGGTSYYELDLDTYTGSLLYLPRIRYNGANNYLQYYNSAGVWTNLQTKLLSVTDNLFHSFKLVVDITKGKYVRLIVDDLYIDLSTYGMSSAVSALASFIFPTIWHHAQSGVSRTAYIDDVIVTQNEP